MFKNITQYQADILSILDEKPYITKYIELLAETDLPNQIDFIRKNGLESSLKLIRQLSDIAPIGEPDKVEYLRDLLRYLELMIHGNSIEQYCSGLTLTEFAKKSLSNLVKYVNSNELEAYIHVKQGLQEDVDRLQKEQESLLDENVALHAENSSLSASNEELTNQQNALKAKIAELTAKYDRLIQDAEAEARITIASHKEAMIAELHADMDENRRQIEAETDKIREEKKQEIARLQQTIEELKSKKGEIESSSSEAIKTLQGYQQQVNSIFGQTKPVITVEWEQIAEDDPIYYLDLFYPSIDQYIEALKEQYMEKTGVCKGKCDEDFHTNCPGLKKLIEILPSLHSYHKSTIKEVITYYNRMGFEYEEKRRIVEKLIATLKSLRLPHYREQNLTQIDSVCAMQNSQVPANIQNLLSNFYWQRKAAEAMAAQKIAEAELHAVVMMLKDAIPQGHNFELTSGAKEAINNREILQFLSSVEQQINGQEKQEEQAKDCPNSGDER